MDELRRVRELAQDAPAPDPTRKAQARRELLQLAEEEAAAEEQAPPAEDAPSSWLDVLRRRWLRPVPAAGLAATALLVVAGVGILLSERAVDPPAEVADPGPTEAPEVADPGDGAVELAATYTDPEGRVTIAYPDDWFTPADGEPGSCRFFGEEEVDVEAATGGTPVSELEVAIRPTDIETFLANGVGLEEADREPLDLAGDLGEHRMIRQRLEATGEGSLLEGVWVERCLVDLGEETLVLTTQDEDQDVLDERRELLEEMVRSLRLRSDP